MKKYDCNKILDCMHELRRLCDSDEKCEGRCPLHGKNCSPWSLTQTEINIIQKWSDETPEPPKLTRKDRAFLEAFDICVPKDRKIVKDSHGASFYSYGGVSSKLMSDMFINLRPYTEMTFRELLELEVEE